MKVMYFELNEEPRLIDVDVALDSMQKLVDGYIQSVYIKDGVYLICNEDGRILNLPRNKYCRITGGHIFGNFFLCGSNYSGDDFDDISLDDYEAVKDYFI